MTWLRNLGAALLAGLVAVAAIWAARRGQNESRKAAKERELEQAVEAHSEDRAKHRARAERHEKNAQEAAEAARKRLAKLDTELTVGEFLQKWGE